MAKWTIEKVKVKDELPDVKIKIDGKIYTGHVRGRKKSICWHIC